MKEAKEAHRIQNKEEGIVAASHELKTPLTAIRAYADLLRHTIASEEQWKITHKSLRGLEEAVRRMLRLTTDFLHEASIESRSTMLQMEGVDILDLLTTLIEEFRPKAAEKSIQLKLDVPLACPLVQSDRDFSIEAISNLIDNGLKYTPKNGTVVISAVPDGNDVRCSVQDSGPGIRADDIPHIFKKFWRAQREKTVGTGLGLYITKNLIEAQGGKIWVENSPQGGAKFSFTLHQEKAVATKNAA